MRGRKDEKSGSLLSCLPDLLSMVLRFYSLKIPTALDFGTQKYPKYLTPSPYSFFLLSFFNYTFLRWFLSAFLLDTEDRMSQSNVMEKVMVIKIIIRTKKIEQYIKILLCHISRRCDKYCNGKCCRNIEEKVILVKHWYINCIKINNRFNSSHVISFPLGVSPMGNSYVSGF